MNNDYKIFYNKEFYKYYHSDYILFSQYKRNELDKLFKQYENELEIKLILRVKLPREIISIIFKFV